AQKTNQQSIDKLYTMEQTVLVSWSILLVIFATVLVMSLLMILPAVILILLRMKRMPEISLAGTV
uniref:Uncharacterized protein n=1 Tax=Xenopus tropicalis TaxID=8364 RepID=A0A6I8RYF3_XENTR